jgi:hypothetical protein
LVSSLKQKIKETGPHNGVVHLGSLVDGEPPLAASIFLEVLSNIVQKHRNSHTSNKVLIFERSGMSTFSLRYTLSVASLGGLHNTDFCDKKVLLWK